MASRRRPQQSSEGWITDVDGIKVGHFTDPRRPTGCT
ncbi:MAG: peptidase S58, partial [Acidobacteria bacterium]